MRRFAVLVALAALAAPVSAQGSSERLSRNRLVELAGHRAQPGSRRGASRAAKAAVLSATERQLVDAMNIVRAQHGLRALTASRPLSTAASVHSVEMVKRGYFEHESANGEDFSVRVRRYYPRRGARTWSIGENLAYGCPALSVDEAMDMWMHSAGHRANILRGSWTEVGVSIVHVDAAPREYEGDPTTVMTVDFGVRR